MNAFEFGKLVGEKVAADVQADILRKVQPRPAPAQPQTAERPDAAAQAPAPVVRKPAVPTPLDPKYHPTTAAPYTDYQTRGTNRHLNDMDIFKFMGGNPQVASQLSTTLRDQPTGVADAPIRGAGSWGRIPTLAPSVARPYAPYTKQPYNDMPAWLKTQQK